MRVLVIGQSKSGTTALLWSAARALGSTETVFEPTDLNSLDLAAPDIVVKRLIDDYRWSESPILNDFDVTLLIYRDPRDRFVSWLLYDLYGRAAALDDAKVRTWLDLLRRKESKPKTVGMTELNHRYWQLTGINLLHALGKTNEALVGFMLRHGPQVVSVRYEDFIRGDVATVSAALGLGDMGDRTVVGPESRVARTKASGSWRHWFTPSDVAVFEPFCAPIMERFGYVPEWELARKQRIPAVEASEYVSHLVEVRRSEHAEAAATESMS